MRLRRPLRCIPGGDFERHNRRGQAGVRSFSGLNYPRRLYSCTSFVLQYGNRSANDEHEHGAAATHDGLQRAWDSCVIERRHDVCSADR
jgi:hypothetical protein